MIRPVKVEPREGFRIWIRYADGASGVVDLSPLAGRGVFAAWNDRRCFDDVHIAPAGGIAWNSDLELCPDALYLQLTGASVEDVLTGHAVLIPLSELDCI